MSRRKPTISGGGPPRLITTRPPPVRDVYCGRRLDPAYHFQKGANKQPDPNRADAALRRFSWESGE